MALDILTRFDRSFIRLECQAGQACFVVVAADLSAIYQSVFS